VVLRLATYASLTAALAGLVAGCGFGSSAPQTADLPTPAPCKAPAYPAPDPQRPRYTLHVDVNPSAHAVTGTVRVAFTPDIATRTIDFRLWPNSPLPKSHGGAITTGPVKVNGRPAASRLTNPTTLVIPHPVAAGTTATVVVPFHLTLPQHLKDRISQRGTAIRLGSFFPILPWVPGSGWALEPPTRVPAETSTSPAADFDATIDAPSGLGVVATGVQVAPNRWKAGAVRDFAVATGDFSYVRRVVHAPGPVNLTVAISPGVKVNAQQAADEAQVALEHVSRLYGPYPWRTLTVAYGPDLIEEGIEYPNLILQGPDRGHLLTAHEIAHQWFYSLVGNDQARDPWLDEGLASWAGAETSDDMPVFANVPIPADVGGHLGEPMTFWEGRPKEYFAGVYGQGVQALQSLGAPARVECALRRYAARNAYRIATDRDLIAAFSTVFPQAREQLARYGVH
jgi:hypothetical protein